MVRYQPREKFLNMQFTNEAGESGEAYVIVPGDKYAQISEKLRGIGKKYGGIEMPATSFNQAEPHLNEGKYVAAVKRPNGDVFDIYAFDSSQALIELRETLNRIGSDPAQYVLTITTPRGEDGRYSGIDRRTMEIAREGTQMRDLHDVVNRVLSMVPGTYVGIREKTTKGVFGNYVEEETTYSIRRLL